MTIKSKRQLLIAKPIISLPLGNESNSEASALISPFSALPNQAEATIYTDEIFALDFCVHELDSRREASEASMVSLMWHREVSG